MLINARIDGALTHYRHTSGGKPRFTRYTTTATNFDSTTIDTIIRQLRIKIPSGKFWREDQPEPDAPPDTHDPIGHYDSTPD